MSKRFKIILTVLTIIAFALLFVNILAVSSTMEAVIIALILVAATVGAMRIIWKKPKNIQ